ncbi:nuclear transport factor 2 family protein [Corallococcus macrosporus]|uniref:SnoaL-like domain-containing protein n=1 Tax=Corallococcus macrosporus DSM 14697 TaxID=1189310 RepID=A0A250JNI2_9BACT|nr:nuclear transport factor 2 family protein [Corallococcus macrosporus]ATB45415.1 hypothetical protein MYMAC_001000 [Corallococcus macrosporus DSM 14697]
MTADTAGQRLETIRSYFRKVDEKDPTLSDLFTDDVRFFFPKFGPAQGKAALARFSERFGREVASLVHDLDGLVFTVDGDRIAVEGQERGVTRGGVSWPDGEISQGRFCTVFEFDGPLIRRIHIYVDPDFTNADQRRVHLFREDAPAATPREVAERYLQGMQAFRANPTAPETLAELLALFDEDADWSIDGDVARVPWIGPRRGRAGVGDFFRELVTHVEPRRFEVRTILADDETAVILGDLASLVKATGRLIESAFAFDMTVRDGRITRYRMFEDSHAVARAV